MPDLNPVDVRPDLSHEGVSPTPPTVTPSPRKKGRPFFLIIAIWQDELALAFVSKNSRRAKQVRDRFRERYGALGVAFRLVVMDFPPHYKWSRMEGELMAKLDQGTLVTEQADA